MSDPNIQNLANCHVLQEFKEISESMCLAGTLPHSQPQWLVKVSTVVGQSVHSVWGYGVMATAAYLTYSTLTGVNIDIDYRAPSCWLLLNGRAGLG